MRRIKIRVLRRIIFQLVQTEYCRSRVMEKASEQTGDESDRQGGYWISLLKVL
ncbi:MAG: hypothetical protein M3530_05215 [Thermoproteota archaeon]|nr:hypothetical protein [Thermoproteota archaeon]